VSLSNKIAEAITKAFSGGREINLSEGDSTPSTQNRLESTTRTYELVEVVNRCINIICDNAALIDFDIKESHKFTGQSGRQIKAATLNKVLNLRPNIDQDVSLLRRQLIIDFLIDGNCFIYCDPKTSTLYRLPAADVTIHHEGSDYITYFEYGHEKYYPRDVIHVADNSVRTSRRGYSRILAAMETLYGREDMLKFRRAFFNNGTSIGLIVESEDFLSPRLKKRKQEEWARDFKPTESSGTPLILDGGMKAKTVANTDFRAMMFNETVTEEEEKIAMVLGVPPILLNSGNNANIKPNLELLFYLNIIPMLGKFVSAYEYYFAFDIEIKTHKVPALKPDLKAEADRVSSLVNNGIITGNEGRATIRLDKLDDPEMDKIRIPANISGSATGVSGQEGGKPPKEDNGDT
jgi:HK97 family phage portal protein